MLNLMLIYIESCYFLSGKESSRLRQNGEKAARGMERIRSCSRGTFIALLSIIYNILHIMAFI